MISFPPVHTFDKHLESVKYCKPLKNGPNLEKESDWLIKEKRNNWYNFKGALKKQNSSKPASAPLLIGHGS